MSLIDRAKNTALAAIACAPLQVAETKVRLGYALAAILETVDRATFGFVHVSEYPAGTRGKTEPSLLALIVHSPGDGLSGFVEDFVVGPQSPFYR